MATELTSERIHALKTLAAISDSENVAAKKLALATRVATIVDLDPSYKILWAMG